MIRRKRWSDAELAALYAGKRRIHGRSDVAVRKARAKLGLAAPRRKWTAAEDALVRMGIVPEQCTWAQALARSQTLGNTDPFSLWGEWHGKAQERKVGRWTSEECAMLVCFKVPCGRTWSQATQHVIYEVNRG